MKIVNSLIVALLGVGLSSSYAADAKVNIIVGGEISPGVYGRVEIGTATPPPVLYPKPVIVMRPSHGVAPEPIYLHVPPGHARNWAKHCAKYKACGQRVYFVKSAEYEPGYQNKTRRHEDDDKDHRKRHGRGHED